MTKPNLFIVGAPKCGTTAWVEYLSSHPDIFFSPIKEPHHFNYDMPKYRWVEEPDRYLELFQSSGPATVVGEASVQYLYSEAAAEKIAEFNPNARIIILVRDQEDFLPSLHNQLVFNGDETIHDFEVAWRLSGKRDDSNIGSFCRDRKLLDYKRSGRFSEQVERYFAHFDAEQIRVVHYRDWTSNPRALYLEIMRFLGLEDDERVEFQRVNEASRRFVNWLTPIVRSPPKWAHKAANLFKAATGIEKLGMRQRILRMNSRSGYLSSASEALKSEIRAYFEHDNQLLEQRIWRPEKWQSSLSSE
jgi:hypothetical protein